ncbi:MAG: sensor domain-containing diguanylate cyclase [Planctomycetaceae bacterium]|nr:sensor domain-containing diguanylate cyclase [Planctomycetaceae bacterium]
MYTTRTKPKRLSKLAVAALITAISLCSLVVYMSVLKENRLGDLRKEQLILEKTIKISDTMTQALHKAEILAVLIRQADGDLTDFDKWADFLLDSPFCWAILAAPDGVVHRIFPEEGNEPLLGVDLFDENVAAREEAVIARDSRQLVMGGPFNAVQGGGKAIVGRMPVFMDTDGDSVESGDATETFWGIVSVSLRFPDILDSITLENLTLQGYGYELWRINPHTNERQTIASNGKAHYTHSLEGTIHILNAEWYLKISNIRRWYDFPINVIFVISLVACSSVFCVLQNNYHLKQMRDELEHMAKNDSLTGIHNRRFFMEISEQSLSKAVRNEEECYIIIFDIDRFKSVNDTHGHYAGDQVLVEVASRIKRHIRPYDHFARYGGEEFIVFVSDVGLDDIGIVAERLRLCLCESKFVFGKLRLSVSASFGVARIEGTSIESAIKKADIALYQAKEAGRNRIVLYAE